MLHVIVPYFNPFNEVLRKKNTLQFLEWLSPNKDVIVSLAEAYLWNTKPLFSSQTAAKKVGKNVSYYNFKTETVIWRKENLINIVVENSSHECFAWIDPDIIFARPDWAKATLNMLYEETQIVQMFSEVILLNEQNEMVTTHRSFIKSHISRDSIGSNPNVLPGHPGFAWAMRRRTWSDIGKLPDKGIVGGGDTEFAYSLIGELDRLHSEKSPMHYVWLVHWEQGLATLKPTYDFLPGAILHYWHGDESNRGYFSRCCILIEEHYNPNIDIRPSIYGVNELASLTPTAHHRLKQKIEDYFVSRVSYQR